MERIQLGARKIGDYDGQQICADTDLHDRAYGALNRHARPGLRVADIGCGYGAFSLRLINEGYQAVGVDVIPAGEQPTDRYEYVEVDLFDPAARERFLDDYRGTFDVVVLLEVIEHVHNPWETLTFVRQLLRDGGVLVLSTPNLTSFFSRFRFLTSGRFHQFDTSDLSYGHINPMTALMIETVLTDTGFKLVEKARGPATPVLVWDTAVATLKGRIVHMASYLVAAALTPLMRGGDLDGWSLIFVAQAT